MVSTVQAQFTDGSGTEGDPWQIATLDQLQEMGNYLDDHFILTADIDASATENWNDGDGFVPIGSDVIPFTGILDGNGHIIENLFINSDEQDYVGLFGSVGDEAAISNVALENVSVFGRDLIGALAGENYGAISNSYITGVVTGREGVGGLVGNNNDTGEIGNSHATADITGIQTRVGGLAGVNGGVITESYATGSITSGEVPTDGLGIIGTGGLVGVNGGGLISSSFASGIVTMTGSDIRVGGLVGYNTSAGEIIDSYATGDVTGDTRVGGLVGGNRNDASITTSFATGMVAGGSNTGGLVGVNTEVITDIYWDTESSGINVGVGNGAGGVGLTTAQMNGTAAFGNMSGFDFDEAWLLTDSYPALHWEDVEALDPPAFTGAGTEEDPWQVATLEQLQEAGNYLEDHFILIADIDASETENWNDGDGFVPFESFSGFFDGRDHTISNLTINQDDAWRIGLFRELDEGGVITNIAIENATVTGSTNVGVLVGLNSGEISNSRAEGAVTGDERIGILAGNNVGLIKNSHSTGQVSGSTRRAGGLAGVNDGVVISSSSMGLVTGPDESGGLVGISGGEVQASWAGGDVSGSGQRLGGLIGYQTSNAVLNNSYATGDVSGGERVGGLVGGNRNGASITSSYATGQITGDGSVGGLVGVNTEVITDSYWDTVSSGINLATGNNEHDGSVGLTTEEMTGNAASVNMSGFDFAESWILTEDYPALYWEDVIGIEPIEPSIWISQEEIAALPTMGPAWEEVLNDAGRLPATADVSDQNSHHDTWTKAAALVCARIGEYCDEAREGIVAAIGTEYDDRGRWLAVGRNLTSYVIAADLLRLRSDGDPDSDGTKVEEWIESFLTKKLAHNNTGEPHPFMPFESGSNASAQEGAAYAAVAAYLGNEDALNYAWDTYLVYVCDDSAPDLEINVRQGVAHGWAHDDDNPCAINPKGTEKEVPAGLPGAGNVYSIDGAIINDIRRGDVYQWPPVYTQYPWVGMEGSVTAALIFHRAGYPAFEAGDNALLRAAEYLWYLREETGNEEWFNDRRAAEIKHLINVFYDKNFPARIPHGGGRISGYTDWTHLPHTAPEIAKLVAPENGSMGIEIPFVVSWEEGDNVSSYNLQVSVDETFSELVVNLTDLRGTERIIFDESVFEPMTSYYWRVQSDRYGMTADWSDPWSFQTAETVSADLDAEIPRVLTLEQNYPNPFNPVTSIEYGLPEESKVQLEVFDLLGRRIAILVNETQQPGIYNSSFDASELSSGVYIYRLQADEKIKVRRMMLVK